MSTFASVSILINTVRSRARKIRQSVYRGEQSNWRVVSDERGSVATWRSQSDQKSSRGVADIRRDSTQTLSQILWLRNPSSTNASPRNDYFVFKQAFK